MNALHYGLTPKMMPTAAAQDRRSSPRSISGSSKVACLIARLRPAVAAAGSDPEGATLFEAVGFGHTGAPAAWKPAGSSIWPQAEEAIRQAVDAADALMAKVEIVFVVVLSISSGRRPASELFRSRCRDSSVPASPRGDIARVLAAGSRHSPTRRPRRAAFACRSAIRSTAPMASAIREACSAANSASTCTLRRSKSRPRAI